MGSQSFFPQVGYNMSGYANGSYMPASMTGFSPQQAGEAPAYPSMSAAANPNMSQPDPFSTSTGGTGNTAPYDPFGDSPSNAVYRALLQMGINPAFDTSPSMKALLNHAEDIYYSALARSVQNGSLGSMGPSAAGGQGNPQAFMDAIRGVVHSATNGGGGLGGYGTGILDQMNNMVTNYRSTGNDTGGSGILQTILSDPSRAASLASSLLYGGAGATVARVGSAPLANLPLMYQQGLENGSWGAGTPEGSITALQLLQRLQGFHAPQGY